MLEAATNRFIADNGKPLHVGNQATFSLDEEDGQPLALVRATSLEQAWRRLHAIIYFDRLYEELTQVQEAVLPALPNRPENLDEPQNPRLVR